MDKSKLVRPLQKGAEVSGRAALPEAHADPTRTWTVLGWIGLAFVLVGGTDFVLAWYPVNFGNREWEFGTVTASFNGLPVVVLGLGLMLLAGIRTGRRGWVAVAGLACAGLFLWVLAAVVLYATNVPLALAAVPVEVSTGMKKAVVRTAVQSVVYPVLLAYLGYRSIQAVRRQTTGQPLRKNP